MKKILQIFVVFILSHASSKAQYVTIPDPQLRSQLQSKYPACFNASQMMDTSCAAIVNETNLFIYDDPLIVDWNGYQYFKNLQVASFTGSLIAPENATLPALPATLKELFVTTMPTLISLPVLPPALERLICGYRTNVAPVAFPASLRSIDFSQSNCTTLSALPASLDTLNLYYCNLITVPALPASLRYLECGSNAITSLPALPPALKFLSFPMTNFSGPLPALPNGLEVLDANTNNISSISAFPSSLRRIDLGGNMSLGSIPALPAALTYLGVTECGLSSLPPLPGGLQQLYCAANFLTALPALPPTLTVLECWYNQLDCLPVLPSGNASVQLKMDDRIVCIANRPSPPYTITLVNSVGQPTTTTTSDNFPQCSIINNVYSCQGFPVMTGRVFNDNNNNGLKDPNEPYRTNVKVALQNGFFTFTNSEGYYEIGADGIGNYSLTITLPDYYTSVPLQYNFTFSSFDTVVSNDFALQATTIADSLTVSVQPVNNAARPGFSYPYLISYANMGTTTLSPAIIFDYDETRLNYDSSSNALVTNNSSALLLTDANLVAGQQKSFISYFRVKPTAQLGDSLRAYLSIQANAITETDSVVAAIIGSFDPNDKSATPALTTFEVATGDYIYYTIRFQNTGTDTAFNVVISDSLNGQLQPATLQVVNTSHLCKITVMGDQVFFEFLDILLPDSNVHEIKSHGYVTFRIKPQPTVLLNSVIPNLAQIYFDYNSPILTNTAITTIVEPQGPVSMKLVSFKVMRGTGKSAVAFWNTSNEINVASYEIEMSLDAINFNKVSSEKAKGYQNNDYAKTISIPVGAPLYFKLKMIDFDGRFIYSPIVTLFSDVSGAFSFLKNPVKNELIISVTDEALKNTIARIYDARGVVVKTILLQQSIEIINVDFLPGGTYYLVTVKGSKQFVKMR